MSGLDFGHCYIETGKTSPNCYHKVRRTVLSELPLYTSISSVQLVDRTGSLVEWYVERSRRMRMLICLEKTAVSRLLYVYFDEGGVNSPKRSES